MKRAHEAGVREIVVIASNPADTVRARAACACDGGVRMAWTAGLHPHEAARWDGATRAAVVAALDDGAVAVGETGLDHHYMNSRAADQARSFADHLALAVERDLPVVVHSREAERETMDALAGSGIAPARVVLHCFAGSRAMLEEAVGRGYYVSFSGLVTFRRFPGADLAPLVLDDRLLVESDAPYLAPVPHRGKRNEPAFVADTARAVADFRGVAPDALAGQTRANALRFYRFPAPPGGVAGAGSVA